MAKTLFVPASPVKPRAAGYTINFNGTRVRVRADFAGVMAVLRVLDQLKAKGIK